MDYRMKDHIAWHRGLEIDKQEGSFNESKSVVNASKMNPRMQKNKKKNKGDTRNTGRNARHKENTGQGNRYEIEETIQQRVREKHRLENTRDDN